HFLFTWPSPSDAFSLSLHDALPICLGCPGDCGGSDSPDLLQDVPHIGRCRCDVVIDAGKLRAISHGCPPPDSCTISAPRSSWSRSEEHTSELQSRENLVCRLLLEKK